MNKLIDEAGKEQLIADFKVVVADAEALLKATANHGGEELAQVRARAEESVRMVKSRIDGVQVELLGRTREAARTADAYVHDYPWNAIGMAAGAGLVIGLLSNRR